MNPIPSPLRKNRLFASLLSFLVILFTAVSCSMPPTPNKESDYLLTVTPGASDTQESLEAQYNGKVIAWEKGQYAVIGVEPNASLSAQSNLEANTDSFVAGAEMAEMSGKSKLWAEGRSGLWAGGRSGLWAEGRSKLWAEGQFTWLPENTPIWKQIKLEQGQALAENLGYGIKVAVIDTGIDLEHPAFIESLAPANEWWDFYSNDALPQEEGVLGIGGYGHGSNVAGIIRQIAPRATILPIRVLGPDGSGSISDLVAAIQWAVDKGANVINLSLGSDVPSISVGAALLNASHKGVLVVASSGNTGNTKVAYPASYATVPLTGHLRLSVTSIDNANLKSHFASYGYNVELAAPGENVMGPAPDLQMAGWTGTSMAAPMASGALALALGETLSVSKSDLAEKLKSAAFSLDQLPANAAYKGQLGKGLDVANFLSSTTK